MDLSGLGKKKKKKKKSFYSFHSADIYTSEIIEIKP